MPFFPPPQSPAPPVRCYEDGSCDPPGASSGLEPMYAPPSPDSYITPATYTPNPYGEGKRLDVDAEDTEAILAAMQYGLDQRRPQLRGLFGGGG